MVLLESSFQAQQIWIPVPALSRADIIFGSVLDKISYLRVLLIPPRMASECFPAVVQLTQKASPELHSVFGWKLNHPSIRFGSTLLRLEIRRMKR